ncbi:putative disease resistance RPP8-like protein 2 [Vitis vinifera]|uniref:Putative disease resistance RPP8-like protein 2 n=1 Tax=Vitis vinifera TaxID=29760 RepID=A0A438J071_VITVI|nr:putative disease resistance RPP8-like protein 2 [Vitis vinifera]
MIQVADTRDDGRVKSFRIHDLLRDLAISEAKEEKLFEVDENMDVDVLPTSVRRLIGNINQTNSSHLKNSNIRSLILNRSIDEGDDQMRHLNCFNGEISSRQSMRERWVDGHLGVYQMTNLQTLYLQGGYWLKDNNLGKLTHHLKQLKLNLYVRRELKEGSFRSIAQLIRLQKLKLATDNFIESEGLSTSTIILFPGLESFSHHKCLYKLHLVGTIPKLPVETTLYPPNLMQLKLLDTKMEKDPMPILGRLPNLRILTLLEESYVGTEMNCPHGGFLRLEFLQMQYLGRLEDLSVGKGAMPNLKTLKTECCVGMRKFPDGLLHVLGAVLTPLQASSARRRHAAAWRRIETSAWRHSPVKNAVQTMENDCDAVQVSFLSRLLVI